MYLCKQKETMTIRIRIMKRLSFAIMLALCTMGVWAQEGIKVEFKGASPDISELGQFDALAFYRYDNATKTMEYTLTPGFDVIYENGITYSLPRVGKDIKVNKWNGGVKNQTTLKWNGHGFGK